MVLGGSFVPDPEIQFISSFSLDTVRYKSSDVNTFLGLTAEIIKLNRDIVGKGVWGILYSERAQFKWVEQSGNGVLSRKRGER